MNIAASVARLMQIKDVTEEDAKLIRAIWKAPNKQAIADLYPDIYEVERAFYHPPKLRATKHHCIDQILNTSGVEFLGRDKRSGSDVYYCNAGDSYATTVVFAGHRLWVGGWADWVEAGRIREAQQL